MTIDERDLPIIQEMINASIARSVASARVPHVLTGVVEDLDSDLDLIYVRMDQEAMGSDPSRSDNYESPGVVAIHRLGETFIGEQVRATFDGAAGASGSRIGVESRIVLPFGQEDGERIIIDGRPGVGSIQFYNEAGTLIGFMDSTQWFVGEEGGAIARLDPLGGLRLRDENDILRVQMSASEGLTLRDGDTGASGFIATSHGLIVVDPETGDSLMITSGNTSTVPTPKWASVTDITADTSHGTPALTDFETGDDLDLRFVSGSTNATASSSTYTPPSGFTEREDAFSNSNGISLILGLASLQPAEQPPTAENFTCSTGVFIRENGHTVIVRGGGTSSPSYHDSLVGAVMDTATKEIDLEIFYPDTDEGDLGFAHVSMCGSGIPVGWTVPEGWVQLGVQVAGLGTAHILASGIWMKRMDADDAALALAGTPVTVHINMSSAVTTKLRAQAVTVSDPFAYPAGLDIRRNNISMPRGKVRKVTETTNTTAWANTDLPQSVCEITDVPVEAGRDYRVEFRCPASEFAALSSTCRFEINVQVDEGSGYANERLVFHRQMSAAGTERFPMHGAFTYTPDFTGTVDIKATLSNLVSGSGYTIQLRAGTGASERTLEIVDEGATF